MKRRSGVTAKGLNLVKSSGTQSVAIDLDNIDDGAGALNDFHF